MDRATLFPPPSSEEPEGNQGEVTGRRKMVMSLDRMVPDSMTPVETKRIWAMVMAES